MICQIGSVANRGQIHVYDAGVKLWRGYDTKNWLKESHCTSYTSISEDEVDLTFGYIDLLKH